MLRSSGLIAIILIPFIYFSVPNWRVNLIELRENPLTQTSLKKEIEKKIIKPEKKHRTKVKKSLKDSKYTLSLSQNEWILLIWISISSFLLIRLLISLLNLWLIARSSELMDNDKFELIALKLANQFYLKHNPKVRMSHKIDSPMTWGLNRHTILLPEYASDWDSERFTMVLTHELAHVKRNDFFIHLIIQFSSALFWFNPLTWKINKQMIDDREQACDDYVVHQGNNASNYAKHLLEIAKLLNHKNHTILSTTCMATPKQLEGRLISILDKKKKRMTSRSSGKIIKLITILIVLPLASIDPWINPGSIKAIEPARIQSTGTDLKTVEHRSKNDLDELKKYKKSGLLEILDTEDVLLLIEKKVNFKQVKEFHKARVLEYFSAKDLIVLINKKIPMSLLSDLHKKRVLDKIEIEEIIKINRKEIPYTILDEAKK